MSEELKPCPFCGGTPTLDDCRTIFAVRCDCGVCMLGERAPEPDNEMTNEYWYHFKMTAIDAWNQREAVSADELAALKAGQGEAVAWIVTDMNGDSYFAYDRQTPSDTPLYTSPPSDPSNVPVRREMSILTKDHAVSALREIANSHAAGSASEEYLIQVAAEALNAPTETANRGVPFELLERIMIAVHQSVENDIIAAVKENFGCVGNDPWACRAVDARQCLEELRAILAQHEGVKP